MTVQAQIKTALLVVVLSCLIWVFAERAVMQTDTVTVAVELVRSQADVFVQYLNDRGEPLTVLQQNVVLTVEGPAGRIQAVREKPLDLKVPLDVQKLKYEPQAAEGQDYVVRVVKDLLEGQLRLKDTELTVTEAQPQTLRLRVRKLVQQSLPIKVYDQQSGSQLSQASTNPAAVPAYVIEGQPAEARVILSSAQQVQAERGPITVDNVVLPYGAAEVAVEVTLPEGGKAYPEAQIKMPRWGILMPASMAGKFKVVIENDAPLKEPITCRGTTQAVAEYRESLYHLVLEIKEKDEVEMTIDRPPHYYLPEGYGPIEIVNPVKEPIRFRLVPAPAGKE